MRKRKEKGGSNKIVVWVMGIMGGLVVIMGLLALWFMQTAVWMGKERFTVITLVDKTVEIESFDPVKMQGIRMKLPQNLEIETIKGRGTWPAGSIFEVGKRFERTWAAESVADFLGISYIDRGANWWDGLRWRWYANQVRWLDIDMYEAKLLRSVVAVDGVTILTLANDWDVRASNLFESLAISQEGLSVGVVNTTGRLGLGTHASRVIENGGVRVGVLTERETPVGKCVLESQKDIKETLVAKWILRWYRCSWKDAEGEPGADMTLVLGKEYEKWWKGD